MNYVSEFDITHLHKPPPGLVDWVVNSMRLHPEHWDVGAYRATHKNGLDVWVSSGPAFVHMEKDMVQIGSRSGGLLVWLFPYFTWRWKVYYQAQILMRLKREQDASKAQDTCWGLEEDAKP